uniref:Uncharacterized protein n=1 Tax=Anguilla anguilla TaxID=7936 RepID=A0A0E9XSD2_ANGAN
MRLLNACNVM